jgi:uncharacterized phiE125 gp8 family phage protein
MGLALVTPAATEPVSTSEAKAHLRVDTADEDTLIASYVSAAVKYIETQTGPLITQTWDYKVNREWPLVDNYYSIYLPFSPVQSVTSVTYVDINGATQTLSSGLYQTVLSAPNPYLTKAHNQDWPQIRDIPDAITVRFVAGYGNAAAVPAPIKSAILLMVGRLYEHREEVIAGVSAGIVPAGIEMLISPYSLTQRSW